LIGVAGVGWGCDAAGGAWAGAYRALGLRGVLMVRRVVLSGRWFRGGRARSRFCVGWGFESVGEIRVLVDRS